MIKIDKADVFGWESAIRGMRNPMNSWDKSDTNYNMMRYHYYGCDISETTTSPDIGANDLSLMQKLIKAGSDHSKFMRMINVTTDITAPLYWWKEYDTYKVGTVANSCSTMHKIHAKEFTLDDFSHEKLTGQAKTIFEDYIIPQLNEDRENFLRWKDKEDWWNMIQLLPTSYNQKRTVQLNYAVLRSMYHARKNHKLDEWHTFCEWVEKLPYAKELITNA
jgi:hypothetical protein